jgi:hypothetical protein
MQSIKISMRLTNLKLKLAYFRAQKLTVLFTEGFFFYKKISNCIFFSKTESVLQLKCLDANRELLRFYGNYLKREFFVLKRFLVFKGIGIRGFLNKQKREISLKLGYSHLSTVSFSKLLNIYKKKNIFLLKSVDPVLLGCFLKKIKFLKLPDSYKGRGIWYKGEKKILKAVKKKK